MLGEHLATMIEQFFAVALVRRRQSGATAQQHESWPSARKGSADHHQCLPSDVGTPFGVVVREDLERVARAQISAFQPHGALVVASERDVQF